MAIRMSAGAAPSRRGFLSSAGAAAAATVIDGVARPYLSFAADRPRITHGLQSGDVSIDSGMVWARADRPSRMLVEVATTESFRHIRHSAYLDVLPESDFTGKLLLEDLPPGQDIFYRVRFQNLASPAIVGEPQVGRFRTAPAAPQNGVVHLVGRHRRRRLGHRSRARRHAHLRDHAGEPPRLLHPLRRHRLCRLPDRRAIQAAERRDVAERRHRGEGESRRDARRVPRQLQIQSARREPARVQRRGADLRAVGRSRSHRRLDPRRQVRQRRRLSREEPAQPVARGSRAFHEFLPLRQQPAEAGRIYRKISYGPLLDVFMLDMRSYRGANAGDVDELRPGRASARPDAARVAQARAAALARDLEGDRRRSAARRVQP